MEFFLPSILFLLVACGIVFFVIPRFGPLVLATVSLVLLALGAYQHYSMFATEYRLSTWQSGMIGYAPIVMIVALVIAIILYLLYMIPSGGSGGVNNVSSAASNSVSLNLPPPGTATNALTEGIGNAMRSAAQIANVNVRNQGGNNRGAAPNSKN